MTKKEKKKSKNRTTDSMPSEIDFSEGFGGIPENVSLTKNIGCASDSGTNTKKTNKKPFDF